MSAKIRLSPLPGPGRIAWFAMALVSLVAVALAAGSPAYAAPPAQQQPTNIAVTRSADATSATITWTPAPDALRQWVFAVARLDPDEPNPDGLGYKRDTLLYPDRVGYFPGDTAAHTFTGLDPSRAYAYGITTQTANAAGVTAWSDWVIHSPPNPVTCYNGTAVPEPAANAGLIADCRTLLSLRDALQGSDRSPRLNWTAARAVADWEGIAIDGTPPRVVTLSLKNRLLSGILPPALGQLDALRTIYLADNALEGEIPPELGNLANLISLNLEKNDLEGAIPPELGNLSQLAVLTLSNNHLGGDTGIPAALGQLRSLEVLHLADNELEGEIPPQLGNLPNLTGLYLGDNLLHEEIPPELGNLANLTTLSLFDNHLHGSIPPELASLTTLRNLSLANNRLRGPIPPELGNLPQITVLLLDNNRLSGSIPPELGNLSTLSLLYLSDNRLTGEIPPELGRLPRLLALFLHDNDLTGAVPPELGQLNLLTVRLSGNLLTGCLPAVWQNIRPDLTDIPSTFLPFCEAETPPAQ